METHAPHGYRCPLCNVAAGGEDVRTLVWKDEFCIAAMSLHQVPSCPGSIILFPLEHHENLYVLPDEFGVPLFRATKLLSVAVRVAFHCAGVTVRQHNEPAGGQDVWHYHVHIIPRFANDKYGQSSAVVAPLQQRIKLAASIRAALGAA